jgi:nucleoside-diphosphate-sugar epimerase
MLLKGKTYWITGATGRLGTEISLRLEEMGAEVLSLVLPDHYQNPKRIKWIAKTSPIFVRTKSDLTHLPMASHIINFHWLVNRNLSFSEQLLYELEVNIHNNNFLWEWIKSKSIESFINISSIKIYSYLNHSPVLSTTEPKPITPYGLMKYFSEKFFDAIFKDSNFRVSHLRLGSIASFGENPSQLITRLCDSAFNGKHIKININHKTHLMYIDDILDLIINTSLDGSRKTYNLISEGWMNEEIAKTFEKISGKILKADYIDFFPGQSDLIFSSDINKLKADWICKTPLELMIHKIINQYIGNLNSK